MIEGRPFPLLSDMVADLKEFSANPRQRQSWGFSPTLDIITEGPAAGEVFVIIGRSFTGKSLVATNLMASNPEKNIIFFSLEMPGRQALQRLYATWAGVDHRNVQDMTKRNALPHHLEAMAEDLGNHVIIDKPGLSLEAMSGYLQAYDEWFGQRPDAVIIDYLELIAGGKGSAEGWIRTEATASNLKDWSKDEKVPVFALHQTNKEEQPYKAPTENSARGAGFTEADCVVGIWVPNRDPEMDEVTRQRYQNEMHLVVLKNRITGRVTYPDKPIRFLLKDDLSLVDLAAKEASAS